MPTALEASSMKASTKYNLQFIKNFGNQSVYSLPRTAPESECYTLASGGELYECFVYAAKANLRTIWIPKSIKVLHKKPYIYLIDPTTPSFRTDYLPKTSLTIYFELPQEIISHASTGICADALVFAEKSFDNRFYIKEMNENGH